MYRVTKKHREKESVQGLSRSGFKHFQCRSLCTMQEQLLILKPKKGSGGMGRPRSQRAPHRGPPPHQQRQFLATFTYSNTWRFLWHKESGSGWGTFSFSPPHIGEMAQTREPSRSAADKPLSQKDAAAVVGMTHLSTTQLDGSISMVTSMLCLHHPHK